MVIDTTAATPTPSGDYAIGPEQLSSMTRDHNFDVLQQYGGVNGLSDLLKTNLKMGINGNDADLLKRRNAFGSNTYPKKKGPTFWMFLWASWQNLTLIILMVAMFALLVSGIEAEGLKRGWYDGGSIAFAVFLVLFVTAISDYRQSLQFQNLNEEKRNIHSEVIRDGRPVKVSVYDIVVGDIVPLNAGDQVPADGILISGHSLDIDESSMTGESNFVRKDQKVPFLMSGCKVAEGVGTMLVTGVGINTEWGLLMAHNSEDAREETPLQVRLNGIATFIATSGLIVAVVVLVTLLTRYLTGRTTNADGSIQFRSGTTSVRDAINGVVKIITIVVTMVVVAVPGLPLAVTVILAYSSGKMMADKALVCRLSSCETMGSATTICCDKTGTLTLNQMTVIVAYVGKKKMHPQEDSSQLHPHVSRLLYEGIAQNAGGKVFVPVGGRKPEVSGSATEKAIFSWAVDLGMDFDVVSSQSTVFHVFPFNSNKRRGGVALKLAHCEVHIHWKGAAEIVLAMCTGYLDSNGLVQSIDEDKVFFNEAIDMMAASSLRCIAIAYRSYKMDRIPTDEDQLAKWDLPEDNLILLAIVGIKDPCCPGVKDVVRVCCDAGIKVRMVTGDNLLTAKAVALECGILDSDGPISEDCITEGRAFRELSEKEREHFAKKILVMGRSLPIDKLLLVQALRKGGEVVAVTGDGINDAPALFEADIGLAMDIQGTIVAKERSDIIILDDNFASIVKVVRWSRLLYANIQKFIQFQLTVIVTALTINVAAAFLSGDVPLTTVQLLWVNLIMDTVGALALGTEPPTDHLMHQSPVGRREPLITCIMWRNLILQALYQVSVFLVLYFGRSILQLEHDTWEHAVDVKSSMIFNTIVLCQIFNAFNARKPDEFNVFSGVTKNHLFMGIVGVTFVLQIIIMEFLGKLTSTVRLGWKLWLFSLAIAFVSLPLAVVAKFIPVPKAPLCKYSMKPSLHSRRECNVWPVVFLKKFSKLLIKPFPQWSCASNVSSNDSSGSSSSNDSSRRRMAEISRREWKPQGQTGPRII